MKRTRHRHVFVVFVATLAVVTAVLQAIVGNAGAQSSNVDRPASEALTSYLREHHLPLVGASVSKGADGSTQVMLYGYVATEKGKQNAASRAAKYFHNDPRVVMINRIAVNPEIRNLGSGSSGSNIAAAPDSGMYAPPHRPVRSPGIRSTARFSRAVFIPPPIRPTPARAHGNEPPDRALSGAC